ncbi:MAG: hypothetical protein CL574_04675 [Altererythrobacter sp.]|nr:hypothetical protein [Altererythrobacter sp.]|tara:strand:+ start:263 stop:514 length:252 start_codon:yes stop_codon:yes gene_type:complete
MKPALALALPLALTLGACGEPIDGSDTADMQGDAVTAPSGDEAIDGENPATDGMLETEVETDTETTGTEPVGEPMMESDETAM